VDCCENLKSPELVMVLVFALVVLVIVVVLGLCLFVYTLFKCDGDRVFVCLLWIG